jgi:ABC-type sugar transport system substrate-binding protein
MTKIRARGILALLGSLFLLAALSAPSFAQQKKPNILVIFGDDIGYWNISANNQGTREDT